MNTHNSLKSLIFSAIAVAVVAITVTSCSSSKKNLQKSTIAPAAGDTLLLTPTDENAEIQHFQRLRHQPDGVRALPKAYAYRMSGDFEDYIPITLNANGTLASYPAPTDITDTSTPIKLADGWWLDRRGVTDRSVFIRYTYAEYAALKQAPTPAQLMQAIIPDARVTAVMPLRGFTPGQAEADTAAVNAYIRENTLTPHL